MSDLMDVEAFVSRWLRTRTEITDLVEQRVWTKLPREPEYPFIEIYEFHEDDVTDMDEPWLVRTVLEITCYANTRSEAKSLARTVQRVARRYMRGKHEDEGVVTGVKCVDIGQRPDTISKPPRDAYIVNLYVWSHPLKGEIDS